MARRYFDFGDVVMLAILAVPFYIAGTLPALTLIFVVAGSFWGYVGRPMPRAKELMLPGIVAGIVGTSVVKLAARQAGYVFMVTSTEILWWSAWFAFWSAPMLIGLVLRVRGLRPTPPPNQP